TAFLNSPLREVIYIVPPTPEGRLWKTLWKLLKALYGLKQSSRAWYETVTQFLREINFRACESDPCVLIKLCGATIVVVLLYVDDLL
uniref:Reverse transcriptase Ty1/copia-type domain-containing protein n=1 Tax=Phytophthora ramorum TaxID=164328 RepID=H3G696_PHYRM